MYTIPPSEWSIHAIAGENDPDTNKNTAKSAKFE
jgi:hypothetical protein